MVEELHQREVLFIPDSGILKDRLISCAGDREQILRTIECLICKKIAYYPKYCTVCEKLICTRCLESQKSKDTNKCPKVECQGNKLVFMESNQLLSIIVSTLEFKCHNEVCKDKLKYSELDKHLCQFDYFRCKSPQCFQQFSRMLIDNHEATCEFILTRCGNIGCEQEVERGQMKEHARQCDYRRIICPGCQELKLQKEMTEHENICSKIQLKCTYADCPLLIPRGDMEVHLVECDFRPLKCPDCEDEHPQKDIEEHKSRCPKANLPCSECGYLLHREDIPAHHCLRYLADQLRNMDDIQVRKHKIIAHLVQREPEIETSNNIIMQNQIVMNQKIDRIEKREADLERANKKYIQNSMDILKNTKEIEEKERKIDHKLKILEEKEQLFENSTRKTIKTLENKLRNVEEREFQLLQGNKLFHQLCRWIYIYIYLDTVRIEQRAEEINVRTRNLEEHDARFTEGHKKHNEDNKIQEQNLKEVEDKLRKVEEREEQLLKGNKLFPLLCRWVYIYIYIIYI